MRRPRPKFRSNADMRTLSRWIRGRITATNNIDPFILSQAAEETAIERDDIYKILTYWRKRSKVLWDHIHVDTEDVYKDWETFLYNLNNTHEVYFMVPHVYAPGEEPIWYQPDFGEKQERDNRRMENQIKGMFTVVDEMAMMGETIAMTGLPAAGVIEALKGFDQRYLRDGVESPSTRKLLSERTRVYTCPVCLKGKMMQLRGLDWQCRECRVIFKEDEFNDMIKTARPKEEFGLKIVRKKDEPAPP